MVHFTSNTYQTKRQILSFNDVTFSAMERAAALFERATFVMDHGYDDNKMFQFENFQVRKLKAINALNFYLTLCMAFLGHISMRAETNMLKAAIIQTTIRSKKK